MLFATPAKAEERRVKLSFPSGADTPPTSIWKHPFIDRHLPGHPGEDAYRDDLPLQTQPVTLKPGSPSPFPIGYLVKQEPDTIIQAHFHRQNQFQVFSGGGGIVGRHDVRPLAIHYADNLSTYGPIQSSHAGLDYFTLRPGWDELAFWMPDSAAELKARRGTAPRSLLLDHPAASPEALRALASPTVTALHAIADDGLGVIAHRLPPGAAAMGADPSKGKGQYWLVAAGSLRLKGEDLPPLSLIHVAPDDDALDLTAGEAGLEVIMMQFPLSPQPSHG